MDVSYWNDVVIHHAQVPVDRTLTDLTTELVRFLGDPDPAVRDGYGYRVLATWLEAGVYDDLLPGFGDGLLPGLRTGLGADGEPSVFRRSFSALVLSEVLHRDNAARLVTDEVVLRWGDALATWWLHEQDLRGWVEPNGYAHAAAHGADAISALARSRHCDAATRLALVEVLRDRVITPTPHRLVHEEHDRIAHAVMTVLHRGGVDPDDVQAALTPLARTAAGQPVMSDSLPEWPTPVVFNSRGVLRALHSQLALGVVGLNVRGDAELFARPVEGRSDLLLWLSDRVRETLPYMYRQGSRH